MSCFGIRLRSKPKKQTKTASCSLESNLETKVKSDEYDGYLIFKERLCKIDESAFAENSKALSLLKDSIDVNAKKLWDAMTGEEKEPYSCKAGNPLEVDAAEQQT